MSNKSNLKLIEKRQMSIISTFLKKISESLIEIKTNSVKYQNQESIKNKRKHFKNLNLKKEIVKKFKLEIKLREIKKRKRGGRKKRKREKGKKNTKRSSQRKKNQNN